MTSVFLTLCCATTTSLPSCTKVFVTLNPGQVYHANWHIEAIA